MNKGNQPGKTGQKLAESVEQRDLAEGNAQGSPTDGTLSPTKVSRGLLGVREAAHRDRNLRFTALLHHVTVQLLRESYMALKREAAPGVDGVTWRGYQDGMEDRLRSLHERIHKGMYRAQPSKRTRIPKEDGRERKLGIACLEDKIVQKAIVTVLNCIYEEDFKGFSYGFRPGRSQHQALDALYVGLTARPINWVLDLDIRGYFDNIQHDWLVRFLEHRIGDKRVIRLIRKWLRVGVLDEGQWLHMEEGSPQGAVISPLLSNIYLHYVFDLWAERWRRQQCGGAMIMVRYADDILTGHQRSEEAIRFQSELEERLKQFGLQLNPEKSRRIEFGRKAASNRTRLGKSKPETFDFLGFTHICSRTRKGRFTIRRKTKAKRRRAKLQEIKTELRRRMHESVPDTGKWLRSVLQGYYQYFAVPYNLNALISLRYQVARAWIRMLRRRSHKARKRMTWEKFKRISELWLPKPQVLHPWPNLRFRRYYPR
jgi:group II intron reverse transcriptase/maturase